MLRFETPTAAEITSHYSLKNVKSKYRTDLISKGDHHPQLYHRRYSKYYDIYNTVTIGFQDKSVLQKWQQYFGLFKVFESNRGDEILLLALDYMKKSDQRNSTIKILLIVFVTSTSYSDQLLPRKRHAEKVFLLITMYCCRRSRFCSLRFSIQDQWLLYSKWLGIFFGIDSGTFNVILLVTCTIWATRNTNVIVCFYKKAS